MTTVELYKQLEDEIRGISASPVSIENWTSVCSLMSRGMKAATIAKESDVSVLRFYRLGLEFLRRPPKEFSIERALETLDDSGEFYSADEQLITVNAFTDFAEQLEAWAESQDINSTIKWRCRENVKAWSEENLEESDRPPYFAWVLVNINRIQNHFRPPYEPYATELNTNPYAENLFTYQTARKGWKFLPRVIDALLSQMSSIPEENPLIGKYLKWGAESVDKIPRELLNLRDGVINKELFKKNLEVRNEDYTGLFKRLNDNVREYGHNLEQLLIDRIGEFFSYSISLGKSPVKAVLEKLSEIEAGINNRRLVDNGRWHPVLAAALRLPRYDIVYFDWACTSADEGPDEPGLMYALKDGSSQEVHYRIEDSKWHDDLADIEDKIDAIVLMSKNIAIETEFDALLGEWVGIGARWKKCCPENGFGYHNVGDLDGFAVAFTDGLLKLAEILPNIRQSETKKEMRQETESLESAKEDAEMGVAMMDIAFDRAIEKLGLISQCIVKRSATRWLMPREKIDSLKELVPHQADEIETTFQNIFENGFEPHQFLMPEEPFMREVLYAFSKEFFEYRLLVHDDYFSNTSLLNTFNGNKAKLRVGWDELLRTIDGLLPAKASVIRLHGSLKRMLDLFENRLLFCTSFDSQTEYDRALTILEEKLTDVAADLREQNMLRIERAEEKRRRKANKRMSAPDTLEKSEFIENESISEELVKRLDRIETKVDNTNRNALRGLNETKQVRKNTVKLLHESEVDEELTDHDNKTYKTRYQDIDLAMLNEVCTLVDSGKMKTISSAAEHVFKQYQLQQHKFSGIKSFKTICYRYKKNKRS